MQIECKNKSAISKKLDTARNRNRLMTEIRGVSPDKPKFQFACEKYYARIPGQRAPHRVKDPVDGVVRTIRSGDRKPDARYIVGEMSRADEEFTQGIMSPQPPNHLFGILPSDLMSWYDTVVAKSLTYKESYSARSGKLCTRAQRASTAILVASVYSYPGISDDSDQCYTKWKNTTVEWVKNHYGSYLISIVEHTDERHGHLHAIACDEGKPIKNKLTCGNREAHNAKIAGAKGKALAEAYKNGCKKWQDSYFDNVCGPLGMQRRSPKPERRLALNLARQKALEREEEQLLEDALALQKFRHILRQQQHELEQAFADVETRRRDYEDAMAQIQMAADLVMQKRAEVNERSRKLQIETAEIAAKAKAQAGQVLSEAQEQAAAYLAAARKNTAAKRMQQALAAALATIEGPALETAVRAAHKAFFGAKSADLTK